MVRPRGYNAARHHQTGVQEWQEEEEEEEEVRRLQNINNNNGKNNNKNNKDPSTEVPSMAPSSTPSQAPTRRPTTRPAPTRSPTMMPTRSPTVAPTTTAPSYSPTTSTPTMDPSLHDTSAHIVGSFELLFSLYSPVTALDVQEATLTDILNMALCNAGVRVVDAAWESTCLSPFSKSTYFIGDVAGGGGNGGNSGNSGDRKRQRRNLPGVEDTARLDILRPGDTSTVVWDIPLTQTTLEWLDDSTDNNDELLLTDDTISNQTTTTTTTTVLEYWQWNFTYRVLEHGDQSEAMIQNLFDTRIISGHFDAALNEQWPSSSSSSTSTTTTATKSTTRASLVGMEMEYLWEPIIMMNNKDNISTMDLDDTKWGIPQRTSEILKWIGVVLCVLTVASVILLTSLARKHRRRKQEERMVAVVSKQQSSPLLVNHNNNSSNKANSNSTRRTDPYGHSLNSLEAMLHQSRQFVQSHQHEHQHQHPQQSKNMLAGTRSFSSSWLGRRYYKSSRGGDEEENNGDERDSWVENIRNDDEEEEEQANNNHPPLSPRSAARKRYIEQLAAGFVNEHVGRTTATIT